MEISYSILEKKSMSLTPIITWLEWKLPQIFCSLLELVYLVYLILLDGYAFSYPNQTLHGKELKGFRLGVTFNIPTEPFKNSSKPKDNFFLVKNLLF